MHFYSVQAKESIEVLDDQVEHTIMANGRPAARATIERDGKTLKLFKFLPADAPATAPALAAEATTPAAAPTAKAKKATP